MHEQILKLAVQKQDWDLVKLVLNDIQEKQKEVKQPAWENPIAKPQNGFIQSKEPVILHNDKPFIIKQPITEYSTPIQSIPVQKELKREDLFELGRNPLVTHKEFIQVSSPIETDKPNKNGDIIPKDSFTTSMRVSETHIEYDEDGKPKNLGRKLPFTPPLQFNKFQDTVVENRGELKSANPQLEILYGNKQRQKKPTSNPFVKVKCSKCGKSEEVSPILATYYSDDPSENSYYCNECIVNSKR